MFEEAQLYSPVTKDESGKVAVHLGEDHPGFHDPEYRERRNAIAHASMDYRKGDPVPVIEYTDAENEVWRTVCRELPAKHAKYACRAYNEAVAALDLPRDHIPQLTEVSARLRPLTGWSYVPAPGLVRPRDHTPQPPELGAGLRPLPGWSYAPPPGLVELRESLASLGEKEFPPTQYIRHSAEPLYTPEPDLIHEVIGHGNTLAR